MRAFVLAAGPNLPCLSFVSILKIGCKAGSSRWGAHLGAQNGVDDVVVITGFASRETFHRNAQPGASPDVVPDNSVLRAGAFGRIQQASHDFVCKSSVTTPVSADSGGTPTLCRKPLPLLFGNFRPEPHLEVRQGKRDMPGRFSAYRADTAKFSDPEHSPVEYSDALDEVDAALHGNVDRVACGLTTARRGFAFTATHNDRVNLIILIQQPAWPQKEAVRCQLMPWKKLSGPIGWPARRQLVAAMARAGSNSRLQRVPGRKRSVTGVLEIHQLPRHHTLSTTQTRGINEQRHVDTPAGNPGIDVERAAVPGSDRRHRLHNGKHCQARAANWNTANFPCASMPVSTKRKPQAI